MAADPYGFGNYFADAYAPQQQYTPQQANNQVEWIAAINGQTPQQYLASQQQIQANGGVVPPSAQQQWIDNGLSGAGVGPAQWQAQQDDIQNRNNLNANTDNTNAFLGNLSTQYDPIINQARDRANYLQGINGQMGSQLASQAATSNQMRTGALGSYGTAVGNVGAWDMSNFGNLQSAANAPMQMTASPYVGDAQSDPADLARENAAYNQLQGIANGSLNQTSRAANAYADAGDIQNQQISAANLRDAGYGSLDVDLSNVRELDKLRAPDTIGGMQDLLAASNGSKDVHVGQEDPGAYAASVDARDQLKALTDPKVTASERLIYEMSRQQQEQDERSNREALQTDAARRGVSGTGTNIARSALAAQQTSRNRMLQDMQAGAQAQQRAMTALQGYGTLSTNMSAQANQIAMQNQATQLNALGQYTGISANAASVLGQLGANNATQNANRQLQAQEAAYDAYATLRAQGFSEEYARGQAYDAMANANANRQLAGAQSSGQMAVDMRSQGDAMSRYNQGQRQQQSQFSDSYTANRQDAAYGRQVDVFNAGNTVGRNYMTDQGNLFNATTGVADSNFNTLNSSIGTQAGLNGQWLGAQQTTDAQALGAIGSRANIAQTQLGNNTARIGANTTFGQQAVNRQLDLRALGIDNNTQKQQNQIIGGQAAIGGNYGVGAQGAYTPIGYHPQTAAPNPNDPNDPSYYGRFGTPP
jgi:hypothetical protein